MFSNNLLSLSTLNTENVITALQREYPGRPIIALPPENPREIICELSPTHEHPERSSAIAVIDISAPHLHHITKETYHILRGLLNLYIGDESITLREGDSREIPLHTVHWAEGDATVVQVDCEPGWTPEDHILISPTE